MAYVGVFLAALIVVIGGCTGSRNASAVAKILGAVKAVGLEDISDATVEALNHAAGSGCPVSDQTMLDTQSLAKQVQLMAATGLFFLTGKQAISELFAVVG